MLTRAQMTELESLKGVALPAIIADAVQAATDKRRNYDRAEERNQPAREQALAQYESICAMVGALDVDYDRLEQLNDEYAASEMDEFNGSDEGKERFELIEAANGGTSREDAEQAIRDDALEIQVRSGWMEPCADGMGSEDFYILLCTGGPAVRIRGELDDHYEPSRAWIEYQDWGTPWAPLAGGVSQDTLLAYARCFYFGA